MKLIQTFSWCFVLTASALAQNAPATLKNVKPAANAVSQASTGKPATVAVKVIQVPAKGAVSPKPAVVAAKPAVVVAKPAVVSAKPSVMVAKPAVVTAKPGVVAAKPLTVSSKTATATVKPAQAKPAVISVQPIQTGTKAQVKPVVAGKPAAVSTNHVAQVLPAAAGKATPSTSKVVANPKSAVVAVPAKEQKQAMAVKAVPAPTDKAESKNSEPAPAEKEKSVAQNGRRDPFVSPVVSESAIGSGCSSGKRCLTIDQVSLKGIVKSDNGMIAVVVNAAEKAYFLRENDPVFNGYVVKITGDSIVFKETFHDKFGKPLTRDVTKTISRPVA